MMSIVKQFIRKNVEDKHVGKNVVDDKFNGIVSGASECYSLIPQVPEGTDGHQRIGDKIRPKALVVRGCIQLDNDYVANNIVPPVTVRLMMLSQKSIKVGSQTATNTDVAHLLKDNVGTDVARAYSGGAYDNFAPINKDLFKVHYDKLVRFNWDNRLTPASAAAGTNITKYFSVILKTPASLSFDDGNGDWPNNYAPFFCMGAVCDDGQTPFVASTPFRVRIQSVLYYEDA